MSLLQPQKRSVFVGSWLMRRQRRRRERQSSTLSSRRNAGPALTSNFASVESMSPR